MSHSKPIQGLAGSASMTQHSGIRNLGTLSAVYPLRKSYQLRNLVISGAAGGGALIALVIGLWRGRQAMMAYGPMLVWRWMERPILISAGCALLALVGLAFQWVQRSWRVELHTLGIVIHRFKRTTNLPWSEILGLYVRSVRYGALGFSWGQRLELRLETRDGGQVRLNQATDELEDLMERIKQALFPDLIRSYRIRLRQNEGLRFGPLILTAQGIKKGKQVFLFDDIEQVSIENGRLNIESTQSKGGRTITAAAHHIPNIDLCIQILQQKGQLA